MSISNNLYPPIINTFMPAFVEGKTCKVYFSLSNFNKYDNVRKNVQIIVNDKNTNRSVLDTTLYPAGIKISEVYEDVYADNNMRYYIEISPADLKDGGFQVNRYYKVQIRFTNSTVPQFNPNTDKIASWLNINSAMFSEWSSVCLIRMIKKPTLTIRSFGDNLQNKEVIFTSETIELTGNIDFENPNGEPIEYLDSAFTQLYKKSDGIPSGQLHEVKIQRDMTSSKSEFKYTFKEAIEEGVSYVIRFLYVTSGGYQEEKSYTFKIIQYGIDKINADIFATPDDEEGRIKVEVKASETVKEDFIGKITIRRTSSESGFSEWEDVHHALLTEAKPLNYTWYDYTIKSGVWYKYCVQKRNRRNDRGIIVQTKDPAMATFNDSFLTHGGRQLKLKFDSSINSYKYNVLETKTDTLGSQYPFISRNGYTKYRTFPITGLISSFCDDKGLFTTKQDIYGNTVSLYERYNEDNDIGIYRDYSYEREFRERVVDFLYENNIKLFKSPTEGNILVRLMDINLTPNQQLGRMVYSFTATAHEMDELSIENYNNYNIQQLKEHEAGTIQQITNRPGKGFIKIGTKTRFTTSKYGKDELGTFKIEDASTFGRVNTTYSVEENIVPILSEMNKYNGSIGFDNEIKKLKWLKLIFTSQPYLIIIRKDGEIKLIEQLEAEGLKQDTPQKYIPQEDDTVVLGYWIQINGEDIVIKANTQLNKYTNDFSYYKRQYNSSIRDYEYVYNGSRENGFSNLIKDYYAIYEIDNIDITSLKLKKSMELELDYIAENIQTETLVNLVNSLYYKRVIGQIENNFEFNYSLIDELNDKYNENYKTGYTKMTALNSVSIDAPQGTMLYVKDSLDNYYNEHQIGETEHLYLNDENTTIEDVQFKGVRLLKAKFRENYLDLNRDKTAFIYKYPDLKDHPYSRVRDFEYVNQYEDYIVQSSGRIVLTKKVLKELPTNPIKNGVYHYQKIYSEGEGDNYVEHEEFYYYIFYNDNWYIFDPVEEIVQCPVPALINYYCEVVEGEYDV